MNTDTNTTLKLYLRILRLRWRWVAWGAIAAVALTAAVLILLPPRYRTEAVLFVRTPGDVSQVIDGGDSFAQSRAETYAALAKTNIVASRVIADAGLQLSPQKFADRVAVRHLGGTALLRIRVTGPSADETQRTAQALITELTAEVRSLETISGSSMPRAELVVVDSPSRPVRIFAWGAPLYPFVIGPIFLGAFIGALAAVSRSVKSAAGADSPLSSAGFDSATNPNAPEAL
jgi:capsular polysaccharide biosynthesis protein